MLRLIARFARGVARAASNKRTAPPLIMDGFREGGELRGREEVEGAEGGREPISLSLHLARRVAFCLPYDSMFSNKMQVGGVNS